MEAANTVLIVDDSPMVLKTLSFIVKKAGYNVLSAPDGASALQLLDGREIDLVLTDFHMPGVNGIELINEMRSREYYSYTPAILFVPDNEIGRSGMIEKSGATALFDKSNIQAKIIPTIKKLLS